MAGPAVLDMAKALHARQKPGGSWEIQGIYHTVRSRLHFGAESITTAFAIRALAGLPPGLIHPQQLHPHLNRMTIRGD